MVLFVHTRQSLKRERQQSRETQTNSNTTDSTDEFPCTLCIFQFGSEESLRIHIKTEQ